MWKRLRGLVQRKATASELNEELAFHLEMEIRQNVRLGMSPAEARRAAHVTFGGMERYRERVQEVRSFPWLEALVQDLRHVVRGYRRTPGFTLIVVLTLALGIWGATTIFGVVDTVVLRPLPYPHRIGWCTWPRRLPAMMTSRRRRRISWTSRVRIARSRRSVRTAGI